MGCSRFLSTAIFLAIFILTVSASWADEAAKAGSGRKMQVLVLVGGHGFPEKPFHEIFDSFSDMKCTFVEEKVGGEAFDNIENWHYDAIVLYNHNKNPPEKQRENFLKLLDRGIGLVVLHHGLHAYRDWPEFQKMAGITSFVSEAKDDVHYTIHIEDPQHPIVKGLQDFAVNDETYHGHQIDPKVHVILTTNEPTNYRAIAWVHNYRKSPVCFLQLGHGTGVYGQKEFRLVLSNAIRWSAGRLPLPVKSGVSG
ncbi:MAG: ThuA domain-containing protein [Thermoguttaceae bacterium]|jgi:type 1 glutamine amidotransferase